MKNKKIIIFSYVFLTFTTVEKYFHKINFKRSCSYQFLLTFSWTCSGNENSHILAAIFQRQKIISPSLKFINDMFVVQDTRKITFLKFLSANLMWWLLEKLIPFTLYFNGFHFEKAPLSPNIFFSKFQRNLWKTKVYNKNWFS